MSKNSHRITIPIYLYLTSLTLYFSLRSLDDFVASKWNDYLFGFLIYIAPFVVLLVGIYLYRRLTTKREEIKVLLLGAIPGFFPGAIFGYGIWSMGHGDTVSGFLLNVLVCGIPSALVFGVFGSLFDFILVRLIRK